TFVVPKPWYRNRVPRRGGAGVGPPSPSGGAVAAAAGLLVTHDVKIRDTFAFPGTDPALAAAGAAYLDGHVDPVGAAAAAVPLVRFTPYTERDLLAVFADAWFVARGPVFAAEATAAMLAMSVQHVPMPAPERGSQQP